MSEVDGEIVCITKELPQGRFNVLEASKNKRKSSDSDDSANSDSDSVFEDQETYKEIQLTDKKNGRVLKAGSKVKLQISDIQVSEGTLILTGSMI